MTDTATIRARAARWAEHDSRIPYFDDRLARLNGTNRAGRRPHSFLEPTRKSVLAMIGANDNHPAGGTSDFSDLASLGPAPNKRVERHNSKVEGV